MKVLHVSYESDIRTAREIYSLNKLGIENDLLVKFENSAFPDTADNTTIADFAKMPEIIKNSDADIIHYHDSPSMLTNVFKVADDGRPRVYDCHDLTYHLVGGFSENEEYILNTADFVIHTCKAHQEFAHELYGHKTPFIYVPNVSPRDWIPKKSGIKYGDVVYEGGAAAFNTSPNRKHRDMTNVFSGFRNRGVTFDIYNGWGELLNYPTIKGMRFMDLMRRMTGYEWGFVGNTQSYEILEVTDACKVWDYSMAGLPIIMLNTKNYAEIREYKGLIYAETVNDAVDQMMEVDRDALAKESFDTCKFMDEFAQSIADVYTKLVI